jgi:hypothetical protein
MGSTQTSPEAIASPGPTSIASIAPCSARSMRTGRCGRPAAARVIERPIWARSDPTQDSFPFTIICGVKTWRSPRALA